MVFYFLPRWRLPPRGFLSKADGCICQASTPWRFGRMGCSAAGILVGVPVILAWARPRPFIVPRSIAVSVLVSVPPIWSNVLFANEYGWDIGGKHGATSLGFGVLLTV